MTKSKREKPLRQQAAFKKLRELLKKAGPRDLLWYYRAGECAERLFPLKGGRHYGHGRMAEITTALGEPESFSSALWAYRDFFNEYRRRRDRVEWLANPDNTNGFRVTWTHVKHLLSLDDKERENFLRRCIKNKWTVKDLRRIIKEHRGRKGKGGVPFKQPETLDAGLRELIDETEEWVRRHRQVWFAPGDPLFSEDTPQETPKAVPKLLEEAVATWEQMDGLIKKSLPQLRRLRTQLKKIQDRQAAGKKAKTPRRKK
ncbi:MAG: DUF1016 N-terminal domain-containing protein [Pirellulaceae bacterium]